MADDTDPAVSERHIDRFRSMTPVERATLADALSSAVIDLSIIGARSTMPDASPAQILHEVVARRFGRADADAAHGACATSS